MADTAYKQLPTSTSIGLPTQQSVTSPAPLLAAPFVAACRPPGVLGAARRIVASQHMGGSDEFFITDGTPDGDGTPEYPEPDLEYTALTTKCYITPGNWLEARCLYVPSGATEAFDGASSYDYVGGSGALSIDHDWLANAFSDTGQTASVGLPASQLDDNAVWDGFGGAWSTVEARHIPDISPSGYPITLLEQDKYGQHGECDMDINHHAGARVVHACVSERPRVHVQTHGDTVSTSHGWAPGTPLPVQFPQEEQEDGATYEEHRFGVHRSLIAAEQQALRLGPALLQWTAHSEEAMGLTDTKPDPVTRGVGGYVSLTDSSITTWDADAPGWGIPAAYAQQFAHSEDQLVLPNAATVPVRIRVWANFAASGAATAQIKFQASSRSHIVLEFAQSTTLAEYSTTGYIECMRAGDDIDAVNLIPFIKHDGSSGEVLQVYYWSMEFGAFDDP